MRPAVFRELIWLSVLAAFCAGLAIIQHNVKLASPQAVAPGLNFGATDINPRAYQRVPLNAMRRRRKRSAQCAMRDHLFQLIPTIVKNYCEPFAGKLRL